MLEREGQGEVEIKKGRERIGRGTRMEENREGRGQGGKGGERDLQSFIKWYMLFCRCQ